MARTRKHSTRKHSTRKHSTKKHSTKKHSTKKGGMESAKRMPESELWSERTGSLSARRAMRAASMKAAREVQQKQYAIGKAHEAALIRKRDERGKKGGMSCGSKKNRKLFRKHKGGDSVGEYSMALRSPNGVARSFLA